MKISRLLFLVGYFIVLVAGLIVVAQTGCRIEAAKFGPSEKLCESNLRQIAASLKRYQSARGNFPRALDELNDLPKEVLVCAKPEPTVYIYSPATEIIVSCQKHRNHVDHQPFGVTKECRVHSFEDKLIEP